MTGTLLLVAEPGAPPFEEAGDDQALAGRLAAGDDQALGLLYDRHGTACYRLALRVTSNAALAEEIVQEVFLSLWRDGAYDTRRGSLRSFLCSLAHHKAVDAVRRESALARRQERYGHKESPVAEVDGQPEVAVLAGLRDDDVRAALGELSPAQREALVLAYYGGLSQRQIAERTGVPLGTVKTRTLAGLRRLEAALGRQDGACEGGAP